jgi:hypothetical protein
MLAPYGPRGGPPEILKNPSIAQLSEKAGREANKRLTAGKVELAPTNKLELASAGN